MPRRALAAWLCVSAAMVLAAPSTPGASARVSGSARGAPEGPAELERKRDEARRRQGEVRKELDLVNASAADLSRRLEEIDRDLAARRADAEAAKADSQEAAAAVTRMTAEIEGLRSRFQQRRHVFNRRAVQAYMGGEGRPLDDLNMAGELLSLPRDFTDAARRAELVSRVSHQDGDVINELVEAQARLSNQELVLTLTRNRAQERARDAAAAVKAVAALKAEQEATHSALEARIAELRAEADALAAEQSRLEAMIRERLAAAARARAARGARSPFAGRRITTGAGVSSSGFVWPVQGTVTSGYGYRWGRQHTGIDIAAPSGTPIGAAKAGEVIFTGWMGGYGNLVAVDHGDSVVTLYAHQSRIGCVEGQEVAQGDVIGFVGTTGHSTGNHLHFEVRVDAEPRDPRPYLP